MDHTVKGVTLQANHLTSYDLAIFEWRIARRSFASMLARATAVMITPSKIIQAHTAKRADIILRMQNSPRRHKAAGRNMIDRRFCHGRDSDGRAMSDWRILVRRSDRATKLPR